MLSYTSRPAPRSDLLALMTAWLRDNPQSATYATDRETVEYRIDCRYPGGLCAFVRQNTR